MLTTDTLAARIEELIAELRDVVSDHSFACGAIVGARAAYSGADRALHDAELRREIALLDADIPGRTVSERELRRRAMLLDDPELTALRQEAASQAAQADEWERRLRAADVRQKALRAELAALTALIQRD